LNVLLIDIDRTEFPNLALMKISAWHKKRGDSVYLDNCPSFPHKVYISCVFSWNKPKALGMAKFFESLGIEVELGGSGIGLDNFLPDEIEHIMPDYSLYGVNYSMGFVSRGCIRKCPWCIVPEKEGYIKDWAPLHEFRKPEHSKVILLDNNFLASPKWYENLVKIIAFKLKVNFSQGLDIRLIDQENARLLAKTRYYDWHFKNRRLHFAFDFPEIEDEVIRGIETLKKAKIPPRHLMFYMLVGFGVKPNEYTWDYFLEHDYHRFEVLNQLGVLPYVMLYNDRRDIPLLRHFERWVNGRYYQVCKFEDYTEGESQKVIASIKAKK